MARDKIKVLIVDDSKYMRFVLAKIVGESAECEVIGEARDGVEALEMIESLKPDVVTLDVEMPRLDGLQTLKKMFGGASRKVPVIMISNLAAEGAEVTMQALEAGAVDFFQKPQGGDVLTFNKSKDDLLAKIRVASKIKFNGIDEQGRHPATHIAPVSRFGAPDIKLDAHLPVRMEKIVVIGSSTGGPKALTTVMAGLPAGLPAGFLIVQHMPEGFTASLAKRLSQVCRMKVEEAVDGSVIEPGVALIAPGGYHLRVRSGGKINLTREPEVNNVRPAVDVTLNDVAAHFGKRTICVILTGMGSDGTAGGESVKKKGGTTIAQLGSTCIVNGMPGSLVKAGLADKIVHIERIADEISTLVRAQE